MADLLKALEVAEAAFNLAAKNPKDWRKFRAAHAAHIAAFNAVCEAERAARIEGGASW